MMELEKRIIWDININFRERKKHCYIIILFLKNDLSLDNL